MNKSELIQQVAELSDLPKSKAEAAINAVTSVITEQLKSGGSVALVGFGTFVVKERAAREGRNPATGQAMKIAASKAPGFKPGKALKDALNQN